MDGRTNKTTLPNEKRGVKVMFNPLFFSLSLPSLEILQVTVKLDRNIMNRLMVEFPKGISSNFKVDENINMHLKFLNIFESFGTGLKSFELSEL